MSLPSPSRLSALLQQMEAGLLQRQTAVRLALLAALAGEHVLLIGPPGTAKSALARRLHQGLAGARYFERLLTRFSTPEELFGPLSLKALEDDRYERLTDGFLPTAGIAFLDEVFKANSAILNALLTLLNEREFDNGSGRQPVPLLSVVAASNELPSDEALQAFFDRFLLRVPVAPVDDGAFAALLALPADAGPAPDTAAGLALQPAERQALARAAADVALGADALAGLQALRTWLAAQGRSLSDRRWRQWLGLMRCAAASEGRAELDALDLWLAPYVAAATPDDVAPLAHWVQVDWLGAVAHDAPWLQRAVQAFEQQLQIEQSARDDADADNAAGKLALARAIGMGAGPGGDGSAGDAGGDGMLRLVSQQLEDQLKRRYSPVHIAARLNQLAELQQQVQTAHDHTTAQARQLAQALTGRLWLPPELAASWQAAHDHTLAVLQALMRRLQLAQQGFAALPVDAQQDRGGPAPSPVPLPPPDAADDALAAVAQRA